MIDRRWLVLAGCSFLLFLSASAAPGALRFDGTYSRTGRDRITQHLRFYRDGTVISAATPKEHTPAKIAGWFNRDSATVAKGRYSVRADLIQLTLHSALAVAIPKEIQTSARVSHAYAGKIGADHLLLRRDGQGEERRYEFAKRVTR